MQPCWPALLLALAGCARSARAPVPAETARGPASLATGAYEDGGDWRLIGVGSASAGHDATQAGAIAQARARLELQNLLEPLIDTVSAALADSGASTSLRQDIAIVAQQQVDLSEPHPAVDKDMYATASLDLKAFVRGLAESGVVAGKRLAIARAAAEKAAHRLARAGVRTAGSTQAAAKREAPADGRSDICIARLVASPTPGDKDSCISDDHVARWQGLLRYSCGGGEAEALFGAARFVGTVTGSKIDLALDTSFQLTDGCLWHSHEHLDGSLALGTVRYRYEEAPLSAQKGCEKPCTVTRELSVAP
jgi:hypothetical protein